MGALVEDFDDTTYVVSVTGTWARSTITPYQGAGCLRSKTITDGDKSEATVTVPATATAVQFWYRVSSEATYDTFQFFINGVEKTEVKASGEVEWTQSPVFPVSAGNTLLFRYSKDTTSKAGEDAAYIDELTFTIPDAPLAPRINTAAALIRASRW
ncbi:hypothetical protein GCM10027187_40770 [Streptosporangium sandarakinum]|uniref:Uncharacterized protein n=1 Tax=Streptosporangium sandarakinum TaxID=1260955 RepID=A0A852V4D8_9ACTN|nr:hypothetical protein [Streptosporangium sandarakinum]NYF44592.1 hypothetical protein [Streptosporangium sandarakinum]